MSWTVENHDTFNDLALNQVWLGQTWVPGRGWQPCLWVVRAIWSGGVVLTHGATGGPQHLTREQFNRQAMQLHTDHYEKAQGVRL